MPPIEAVDEGRIDDIADTLLKRWQPGVEDTPPVHHDEEDDNDPGPVEHLEDEGEEDETAPKPLADDEHEVEIGDRRIKVSDLKALAAREADLTQRQAAVERAEAAEQKAATALQSMLSRAQEKWKPYSQFDFLVAQKELNTEEFAALRAQAISAYNDVQYFEQELEAHTQQHVQKQHEALQVAAQDCIKALSDPEKGIKGFGPELYGEMRAYADTVGVSSKLMETMVDPGAFRILHKAMLYDKAQKTGAKKIAEAPKNVNRTKQNNTGSSGDDKVRGAMNRLAKSGDPEDAAAALLARWSVA